LTSTKTQGSLPPETLALLGSGFVEDVSRHIVLAFNEKDIVHPDGRKMNFPKPQGISGSPLWELRRPEDGGPRVAGIMIEHRKRHKAMVAVDIGFALRMLRDHWSLNLR
jgi:hypothetical protein